tara:strand:- start:926 stop:1348 length:423 start_codon:yes stop_codon:yes gene_type:complete
MPTTTATLSLTNDISSVPVSITASFNLLKAGSTEGMDTMTSKRKIYTSTDQVDLIAFGDAGGATHNFVYISNASTVSTDYITVTQGNAAGSSTEVIVEQIGRLYAGDWMLIPWNAADGDADICIKPSTANEMPIEYVLIN